MTLNNASDYLKSSRGKVAKLDRVNLTIMVVGFILTVLGSMASGIFYSWLLCFVLVLLFFSILTTTYFL